jgi:hypothetical protein
LPAAQSVSRAQLVAPQAMVDPQATPPGQGLVVVGVMHIPAPLQVGASRSVAFVHSGEPQLVVALATAHMPDPSQDPSFPHGAVADTAHLPFEAPPALMARHRPSAAPVSAIAHAMQVPVQLFSQQMLAMQLFDAH